ITFLIGCIIAQQGIFHFRRFGADIFVVDMLGVLVLREIGVLLVAIMVAGRSGSAYTAELGSMKMREEIDALRTMGFDPIEVLVLPRMLALVLALPILAFNFTKYPNAAKAFIAFMLEKENYEKWLDGAQGYLTQTLNAYESAPVWTADPKNAVFSQASKRTLPASGIGTVGEKAATAIADFIVVDMFANYCTGSKDLKGAMAEAERQLKRIYR
uniref:extracellular solute-binding protein n=1 Tax=Noviherbaspirillum sp. ST9 TaxID=3401606 RepID=UPI003B585E22